MQVPHDALRVYVMGDRALAEEPATGNPRKAVAAWLAQQNMPWVEVLLAIVLGGAAYFGTMWLVARDQLQYVASKVAPGRFGAPDDEPAEVPVSA